MKSKGSNQPRHPHVNLRINKGTPDLTDLFNMKHDTEPELKPALDEIIKARSELTRIVARACFAAGVTMAIDWLISEDWYNDNACMEKVYLLETFTEPVMTKSQDLGLDEILTHFSNSRRLEERLLRLQDRLHQEFLEEKRKCQAEVRKSNPALLKSLKQRLLRAARRSG